VPEESRKIATHLAHVANAVSPHAPQAARGRGRANSNSPHASGPRPSLPARAQPQRESIRAKRGERGSAARRTAAQPVSGSRSETGTRVRRLERLPWSRRESIRSASPRLERSGRTPSSAEDDGSRAHDAPEPGISFKSRALAVEPAGVDPERQPTSGAKRAHAVISGGRRFEGA
jgi:hypothetical protein